MYIKTVDNTHKDVFIGRGWKQWVRYENKPKAGWLPTVGFMPNKDLHDKIVEKLKAWEVREA